MPSPRSSTAHACAPLAHRTARPQIVPAPRTHTSGWKSNRGVEESDQCDAPCRAVLAASASMRHRPLPSIASPAARPATDTNNTCVRPRTIDPVNWNGDRTRRRRDQITALGRLTGGWSHRIMRFLFARRCSAAEERDEAEQRGRRGVAFVSNAGSDTQRGKGSTLNEKGTHTPPRNPTTQKDRGQKQPGSQPAMASRRPTRRLAPAPAAAAGAAAAPTSSTARARRASRTAAAAPPRLLVVAVLVMQVLAATAFPPAASAFLLLPASPSSCPAHQKQPQPPTTTAGRSGGGGGRRCLGRRRVSERQIPQCAYYI